MYLRALYVRVRVYKGGLNRMNVYVRECKGVLYSEHNTLKRNTFARVHYIYTPRGVFYVNEN